MDASSQLERFVDDGDIRIIQDIAVPQAASNVLGNALIRSPDLTLYFDEHSPGEIFKGHHWSVGMILDVSCQEIALDLPADGRQLTVVFKFVSNRLMTDEFKWMLGLSEATLWSVRNPRVQAAALLRAHANNDAYALAPQPVAEEDGWQAMADHFNLYQSTSNEVAAIDADDLLKEPIRVLAAACTRIGLRYADPMAEGIICGTLDCPGELHDPLGEMSELDEQHICAAMRTYAAIRKADEACMTDLTTA